MKDDAGLQPLDGSGDLDSVNSTRAHDGLLRSGRQATLLHWARLRPKQQEASVRN